MLKHVINGHFSINFLQSFIKCTSWPKEEVNIFIACFNNFSTLSYYSIWYHAGISTQIFFLFVNFSIMQVSKSNRNIKLLTLYHRFLTQQELENNLHFWIYFFKLKRSKSSKYQRISQRFFYLLICFQQNRLRHKPYNRIFEQYPTFWYIRNSFFLLLKITIVLIRIFSPSCNHF